MSALIEGRVAQILSESQIVITPGAAAGARVGMVFVVLAEGEPVKDPQTGETLGRLEIPKGYIRAMHVQEKMTTCAAFEPEPAASADASTRVLSAAMIAVSMRVTGARLNVNRGQVAGKPAVGPISVGDLVREAPQSQEPVPSGKTA